MLGNFSKEDFEWDKKKNKILKATRKISFEEILDFLENKENILAVFKHPNKNKYPNQKVFILNINGYAWVVPFEERGDKIRLITAFPSRKWTKMFLRGKRNEGR